MRRLVRSAAVLLVGAWFAGVVPAQAQDEPEGAGLDAAVPARQAPVRREPGLERTQLAPTELTGPVDPAVYRVGPGDLLSLHLWGQVTRSIPVEVDPEGAVLLPDEGLVSVAGRTLAEVRADILARMHRRYRDVKMELRLTWPRTFRVYLTGQVQAPGPVSANGACRVGDVLANGMFMDGASRRHIEVLRRNGTVEACDLELFLQTGDGVWNPWLQDGDVIRIPSATEFIYAQGAIARPGRYELGVRDSLRTLLRLSGDPLPSAEMDRALLVRFKDAFTPESLWVSLEDVYSRRQNPPLRGGERLYVYFIPRYRQQHEATILGEVQRPGRFPIVEGRTRLSDLVSAADGFQVSADLSAIRIRRQSVQAAEKDQELDRLLRLSRNDLTASEYDMLRTKLAGLREDYRVDWARLQGSRELDLLLRDGDSVRVERLVSSIRVDGEVRWPGILNFVRGESVGDYVAQAGGYTDRAWRGRVRVTRSVTGQTLLARNVRTLDPGDFVWVPEKPDVTMWQQGRELLTVLTSMATIVIAIRSLR